MIKKRVRLEWISVIMGMLPATADEIAEKLKTNHRQVINSIHGMRKMGYRILTVGKVYERAEL